jgi:hypothetical protein
MNILSKTRRPAISLRAAVNAKCKDCIYDPKCGGGTWREQVAQCSELNCPLWPVRPQPKTGPYANQPRVPEEATPEWLARPVGWASLTTLRNTYGEKIPEHLLNLAASYGAKKATL